MLENCKFSCNKITAAKENLDFPASFYDIKEIDLYDKEIDFSIFKGKVVYVVNVASKCGYTKQNYDEFKILKKYRQYGFEIVLAPCNSFGSQEPGDSTEIKAFADSNAFEGIILSKAEVNGQNARPTFKYLKQETGKSYINW
jgi:glutathione peroxidase